ncbi:MAG TPA: NirA family protein [Xanthobacteraceae bacterium]|nr:NirA family protein [Xanthobacteraceae bacterium]
MSEADLKLAAPEQAGDFSPEQKRYLEGFVAGVQIAKAAKSVAGAVTATPGASSPAASAPTGPDAAGLRAQNRVLAAGGKLSDPEKFKREQHPFDTYERLKEHAAKGEYPKPPDNFRWRFFGLFYVAPNQNSYMCRLRIPNGILKAAQFAGIADLAKRYGGGYAHVTTRANLQIREVEAPNAVVVVEAIQDLGLCSRGSGADNIRNVTGTPTAGIDSQELIDTRAYAREWHFHILNDRSLYGLPRKFNVAFDGAGAIPVLEDTNDIGFQAVRVNDGFGLSPGVWFKLCLGGLTGHHDFARDTGVLVQPQDACMVADAVVRIFIDHGDRSDRTKARLKYVLDAMGIEKFLGLVEEKFGRKLERAVPGAVAPRPPFDRTAHIGIHAQKQDGLNWIGVVVPVGRMSAAQMRGLADIARELGDGNLRLTVWQNLLLSGVPTGKLSAARERIEALGLAIETNAVRSGLVACTGNTGCKFAASDTKRHAEEIARWCEARVALDTPVNIHLTGCHHSCAQHFVSEIGLLACKVQANEDADPVEGYHVFVGGGFGPNAALGRELYRDVVAEDAPRTIERILKAYLTHRDSREETFLAFARRHELDALKAMTELEATE